MKKIALSLTALAVVLAVSFTSCKKDDAGAPVITLVGSGSMEIDLGDVYTEQGATATDEEDGTITPTVTGTVNTDKVGEYTVTYTAKDAAGNEASAVTRTVKVKAAKLAASYNVVETYADATTTSYVQTVAVSSTGFNKMAFNAFADYGSSSNLDVTVNANGFIAVEKTLTLQDTQANVYNCRIYNVAGNYAKSGTNYNVTTVSYKLDATPAAGGATQTTNMTQAYTRQ